MQSYLTLNSSPKPKQKRMEIDPRKTCQICFGVETAENKSHISHFGALCCNGCRSFFRRNVQNHGRNHLKDVYSCVAPTRDPPSEHCNMREFGITHRCQKCRISRCLEVGMDPHKVLLDANLRNKFTGIIYLLMRNV